MTPPSARAHSCSPAKKSSCKKQASVAWTTLRSTAPTSIHSAYAWQKSNSASPTTGTWAICCSRLHTTCGRNTRRSHRNEALHMASVVPGSGGRESALERLLGQKDSVKDYSDKVRNRLGLMKSRCLLYRNNESAESCGTSQNA